MPELKKAMILAAGYGTRLKPLTDSVPKALVKVNGIPMIEHVLKRLIEFGMNYVVINTHHFADKIREYFSRKDYGVEIKLIYEKEILGTGGAIKNAKEHFKDINWFIVHNVDILTGINFNALLDYHLKYSPLATLAVKKRNTKRPLIIDSEMNLIGRASGNNNFRYRETVGREYYFGFCGIHIISTDIFKNLTENNFFDIFTAYFRLVSTEKIKAYDVKSSYWEDVGKIQRNIHAL
jgi:NDP-sugar pyrophosphorylase family protein